MRVFISSIAVAIAVAGCGSATAIYSMSQKQAEYDHNRARNNLKQIILSTHNYHDRFAQLPPATLGNQSENLEDNLSWTIGLLPYLEQQSLHGQFDFDAGWNNEANQNAARTVVKEFVHPGRSNASAQGFPVSHFAGIAEIAFSEEEFAPFSNDAPTDSDGNPATGVFASYENRRFQNALPDGSYSTILICEVMSKLGPWARGGESTVRDIGQQPAINGPDGIGSPNSAGFLVVMCGGQVKLLSHEIDASVFKRAATRNGNEPLPDF